MNKTYSLALLLSLLTIGTNAAWGDVLFHETFGNNNSSARTWNDTYSVKSGISAVYSNVSYTITGAKQSKNTVGQTKSGLSQSTNGADATFIVGPLNVANYENLSVSYYWKAGSIKNNTYSTKLYYTTSATETYTEMTTTAKGASSFVECTYNLPAVAQCATLYLKVVFNTSNTQAVIDEFKLAGTEGIKKPTVSLIPETMTLNVGGNNGDISTDVKNYDGALTWTCSKEGIVEILPSEDTKTATIKPLAEGTCDVTASAMVENETYSGTCKVTVKPVATVTSVSVEPATVTLWKGKTTTLTATVTGGNEPSQDVIWKSDNEDVATVADGVITAKTKGICHITATSVADNTQSASCEVTVKDVANTPETAYTVTEAKKLIDDGLNDGKTYSVYINGIIAEVPGINNGIATYKITDGTQTITVFQGYKDKNKTTFSNGDLTDGDEVIVYGALYLYNKKTYELNAGNYLVSHKQKTTLKWSADVCVAEMEYAANKYPTLTITPTIENVAYTYTSSATDVAEIAGEVAITLKSAGTTTITASFAGNDNYLPSEDSYTLTVKAAVPRYTITYETNGGTTVEKSEQQTNLPSTFPTTTKAGYNFYGWYLDVKCETLATAGAPLTDNVTLYAKWEEPYEVGYAWSLIDEELTEDVNVYVKGYVSAIDNVSGITQYGNITYTISDDSKTLTVFRGYNLNNEKFTSADQLHLGDVVVVYGKLINYNGKYEIDASNYIYSRTEAVAHNITLLQDADGYGTIGVDKTSAKMGEVVTLKATPASHYKFTDWTVSIKGSSNDITVTDNTFSMPNADVEVIGGFEELPRYAISLAVAKNGETARGTAYFENTTDDIRGYYADEEPKIVARSLDEDAYIFDKWEVTSGTATIVEPTSATTTLQLSADAEITAYFIPKPAAATITLWENGVENPSKLNGTIGETIMLPATAGGNCNKSVEFVGWSEVEISNSASEPAEKFYAPRAEYTPSAEEVKLYAVYAKKKTEGAFRKVTAEPTDWSGEYLIVYEDENVVFDGSFTEGRFDVVHNNHAVTITNNIISLKDGQDYTFSIAKSGNGYTLQSKSGYYIGGASNTGITANKTTSYIHTFEVTSSEFAIKTWYNNSEGDENLRYLRYNYAKDQKRFRYYKSNTSVGSVALYLKEKGTYSDYSTTCAEAVEVAVPTFSVGGGEYTEAQSVEISCTTAEATIYYTLDGTEPTNASTKYSGAINVDKSMTIKAIAYADAYNYSDVVTAEYVVLQDAEVKWQTYGEDGSSKVDLTEATIYTDGDLDIYVYTPSNGKQTFASTDENVAIVEEKTGNGGLKYIELSVKGVGTTTITVNVESDGTFAVGSASFVLHVVEHKTIVSVSFPAESYDATLGEEFTAPALTVSPQVSPIVYSSSDENVAKVDAATGEITLMGMGNTTITATYTGDETHDPATAQYTLNVTDPNVDIIKAEDLKATNTTYTEFKDVEGSVSHTLYAGKTAYNDGNIQLSTSSKNKPGIISTQSKGFLKTITITFASGSNDVDVYGNITPYEEISDLYGNDRGVKLVTLSGATDSKTVSFTVTNGNYPYIGIRAQDKVVYIEQIAIAWTPTEVIRDGLQEGEFGTVCLNKGIDAGNYLGATFYEIAYMEKQNGNPYKIFFDEVTGELVAGKPYVYVADDEQIVAAFNEQYANAPIDGANGLTGTFGDIRDGAVGLSGNILENNYVISDNKFWLCKGNCWLLANRAYIKKDVLDNEPQKAPLPGRRRIEMGSGQKVPTGVDNLSENATINQALQGTYDVLGRKIAQPTGTGFYIIDGKKVIVVE